MDLPNLAYLLLWPRHSLVIPIGLLVFAFVSLFSRRWRRVGYIMAALAVPCLVWYGRTNWLLHRLPTGAPVSIDITDERDSGAEGRTVHITDRDQIASFERCFSSVEIEPARFYIRHEFKIVFHDREGSARCYFLNERDICGNFASDMIQDVYVPQTPLPLQQIQADFESEPKAH